jgi:hypothetical protein
VTWNEQEEDRLEGLQIAKLRGKGAPKKKRTADGEFSVSYISARPHVADRASLTNMHGEQRARRARRKRGSLKSRSCYICKYMHRGVFGGKYRGLTESYCGWKAQFQCGLSSSYGHFGITYMHSCLSCAIEVRLSPAKSGATTVPYLSRFTRRTYPQTGPTVARALKEPHLVLKEPNSG